MHSKIGYVSKSLYTVCSVHGCIRSSHFSDKKHKTLNLSEWKCYSLLLGFSFYLDLRKYLSRFQTFSNHLWLRTIRRTATTFIDFRKKLTLVNHTIHNRTCGGINTQVSLTFVVMYSLVVVSTIFLNLIYAWNQGPPKLSACDKEAAKKVWTTDFGIKESKIEYDEVF